MCGIEVRVRVRAVVLECSNQPSAIVQVQRLTSSRTTIHQVLGKL